MTTVPTFIRASEGDTVKAVTDDPTFSVIGTIDNVTVFEDEKLIVKQGSAFTLRLRYEKEAPELFVQGENYGEVNGIEVL